jgi:hypothetical protein
MKTVINRKEVAICKRRGHKVSLWDGRWSQCQYCGLWLREVKTIEEREDEPPEAELASEIISGRLLAGITKRLDESEKRVKPLVLKDELAKKLTRKKA